MVQQRNIVTCIILSIVTCGIYGIIWFINLTDDTNTAAKIPDGTPGGKAFLLGIITCGIYFYIWMYKQGEKLDAAKAQRGMQPSNSGVVYLLLSFVGLAIVSYALMQDTLNKLA